MAKTARAAGPPQYLDELDKLLRTNLDSLVEEYRDIAAANGTSEEELREWLSDDTLLDYQGTAAMCGVGVATLRDWVGASKGTGTRRYNATCFIEPDVSRGTKTRLWRASRVLLWCWRNKKIHPGTRRTRRQEPVGKPRRARAAA